MASNIKDTSEVWDDRVDSTVTGIVDEHGGCEHWRGIIGVRCRRVDLDDRFYAT